MMSTENPQLKLSEGDESLMLKRIDQDHERILGNLTLFSPDESQEHEGELGTALLLERPVTPIQDEITEAPSQLEKLQELIRRRIQPDASRSSLTVDQQREIAGIIIGEVNGCWRDIRQQIDYPFFSTEENHELNRRIALHVVTVCAELYKSYCDKAQSFSKKGVFGSEANLARMKIQLSLEARKFLNVLVIRRYICEDIKEAKAKAEAAKGQQTESCVFPDMSEDPATIADAEEEEAAARDEESALTFKSLLERSRPVAKETRPVYKSGREMVLEMKKSLPSLDIEKLVPIVENLPKLTDSVADEEASISSEAELAVATDDQQQQQQQQQQQEEEEEEQRPQAPRSESALELRGDRRLANEIDLDVSATQPKSLEADEKLLRSAFTKQQLRQTAVSMSALNADVLRSDLRQLAAADVDNEAAAEGDDEEAEDEMPALVQASLALRKEENRLQQLMRKIEELDAKARKAEEAEFYSPPEPTHPQPFVLTTSFSNTTVRISDVRPPERRCLSRVCLDAFPTIWNDLAGDIDADTVKELDSGLFKGQEIREVYEEILKTVDQSHLRFTRDPLVEPCPRQMSLHGLLASGSLYRRQSERVVNEKLRRDEAAPWRASGREPRDWARPAVFAPGDKKGALNLAGIHDSFATKEAMSEADAERQQAAQRQELVPRPGSRAPCPRYALPLRQFGRHVQDSLPKAAQDRVLRGYQAWLEVWKEDLSSEDYKRYLATQETDYLGLVFHMYDSEDDEDEEAIERQKRKEEKKRQEAERREKLEQLLAEKNEFSPGFWNTRAVFMGGLGRDPDLPESTVAGDAAEPTPEEGAEQQQQQQQQQRQQRQQQKRQQAPIVFKTRHTAGTAAIRVREATAKAAKSATMVELRSVQERLEEIWAKLRFPDSLRLDMAIKYSKLSDIEEALDAWERATDSVLQREAVVSELEQFERWGSDPNRFFARGHRGSSRARLQESDARRQLHERLRAADQVARGDVERLQAMHGDTVTFHGRPYLEKMKWDKTEMLYWLQEERRQERSRASPTLPPIGDSRG